MATELTAADLARWEALAAAATDGPWWSESGTIHAPAWWPDAQPHAACHPANCQGMNGSDSLADADFIAASREAVPALVAIVRELARALDASRSVDVDWRTEEEYCEYCRAAYHGEQTAHEPGCIIRRARALLGDSTTREG